MLGNKAKKAILWNVKMKLTNRQIQFLQMRLHRTAVNKDASKTSHHAFFRCNR